MSGAGERCSICTPVPARPAACAPSASCECASCGCAGRTGCDSTARPACAPTSRRIVDRDLAAIRDALAGNRRGYTPEWTSAADSGDAGIALLAILARQLEIQDDGVNAMPQRLALEFLDTLGGSLLPAQSARAPLVFKLLDTATSDATVPAGTRVAAVLAPPAPSLEIDASAALAPKPEFFTEQEVTAMRGRLAAVYSIDPQDDRYADHSGALTSGFTLWSAMGAVPHRIYLGHDALFRLAGSAQIVLTFDFASAGATVAGASVRQRPLLLDWEYLSEDGWLPLTMVDDRTERFTRDGKVVLGKTSGPDAAKGIVGARETFWIRGTVAARVPSARIVKDPTPGASAIDVERATEILPGDIVTVDGVSRATVLRTSATEILVDAIPDRVRAGDYLVLADALPPLRPDGADAEGTLPRLDVVRARVGFSKDDLPPDKAFLDAFAIDIGKDFFPFGVQPARFASFYLACRDAFSRTGARIDLAFSLAELGTSAGSPAVVAEYFDGTRWTALGGNDDYLDEGKGFTQAIVPASGFPIARVSFVAPAGWVESDVNGERDFWLRFRLASGDYGQPVALSVVADPSDNTKYVVHATAATLAPPVVAELRIGYVMFSNPAPLDGCVTENDFELLDHTEDARWPRRPFAPFTPVSDRAPALHLGFSAKPPAALVSLLAAIETPSPDAAGQPFAWDYWGSRGWTELSVRDVTNGLTRTGLIQFIGAPDAAAREGLGGALYRIRARLKSGLASQHHRTTLAGVWQNAVWAAEGTRFVNDTLGISNGNPDQTFALPLMRATTDAAGGDETTIARDALEFDAALDRPVIGVPVLEGEVVEVREWVGRGDDWQTAVHGVALADLRFEEDPADRSIKTAVWVRWYGQPHLYASGPDDRHYVVERSRGLFRFPGVDGLVPPAGSPIVVSYVTGGGIAGNVEAGAIRELRSGVGFIESVTNPLPAGGGASAERLRSARDRGAQHARHRGRAVGYEDYEWLAREASSEVARARALPLAGAAGAGSRGHIGLIVVPHSTDAAPMPSRELGARVLALVGAKAPAGVARGIRIIDPDYVRVAVRADIVPRWADQAGRIEARVRARLAAFLHPLTGGRGGRGWSFGMPVFLSDVAWLLEGTPGVDAVPFLQLAVGQSVFAECVPIQPKQLVAAGDSQLKLVVTSARHAFA